MMGYEFTILIPILIPILIERTDGSELIVDE